MEVFNVQGDVVTQAWKDGVKSRVLLAKLGLKYPYKPEYTPETVLKIVKWIRLRRAVLKRGCSSRNDAGRLTNLEDYLSEAFYSLGLKFSIGDDVRVQLPSGEDYTI